MNLNDKVSVKLTPKGRKVLVGEFTKYGVRYTPRTDGLYVGPLWALMDIFGGYMLPGAPMLFEDNEVTCLEDD